MPCSEGAADPCDSSSMIATVCQDGDTAGVPPLWNRLGVVTSSRVMGGLVEAKAAVAQHVEYMSVRAEPAEEVASRHGKARRRYTSAGRGSKAEHFAPKTPPPAASAPRVPKASASEGSAARPKAIASRSPPLPKASTACAIVPL